jgi:TPP-dependent pyruvate/acetoin dehydrogenase alpha subunit
MAFLPADFEVPTLLETDRFRLRPISVDDPDKDYEAVMSSRAELWRRSPLRRSGAGPHPSGDARPTPVVC